MLDGIDVVVLLEGPLERRNASRAPRVCVMKTSVLPVQIITRRSQPCLVLNARMSATTCSARSRLFLPFLTFGPSSRLTYRWSNTAGIGLTASSSPRTWSSWPASSTPAVRAAA